MVDPGWSPEGPRPYVVTADRQARRLAMIDFPTPVTALARVKVPKSFNGRNPQMRRDLASALRTRTHDPTRRRPHGPRVRPQPHRGRRPGRGPACRGSRHTRATPARTVRTTPGGPSGIKLDRDAQTLKRRVEQRTNTVARQFDRVCEGPDRAGLPGGRAGHRAHPPDAALPEEPTWSPPRHPGRAVGRPRPVRPGRGPSVLVFEARRPDDASSPLHLPAAPSAT